MMRLLIAAAVFGAICFAFWMGRRCERLDRLVEDLADEAEAQAWSPDGKPRVVIPINDRRVG